MAERRELLGLEVRERRMVERRETKAALLETEAMLASVDQELAVVVAARKEWLSLRANLNAACYALAALEAAARQRIESDAARGGAQLAIRNPAALAPLTFLLGRRR